MVKDFDRPMEPARKRAERKWRNNAVRKRFKEGKSLVRVLVDPECIDYENRKVHLPKEAPPEPAEVLENPSAKVDKFERKFVKDIKEMMEGHKQQNMAYYAAAIRHEKRKLLIEMIKRKEAKIAAREGAKS